MDEDVFQLPQTSSRLCRLLERLPRRPASPARACAPTRWLSRSSAIAWSGCAGTTARLRRRAMQVKCAKCSAPIALSDIIEPSDGRLSHMYCKIPHMLSAEERALLFVYCFGHAVAYCLDCDLRFRMTELA